MKRIFLYLVWMVIALACAGCEENYSSNNPADTVSTAAPTPTPLAPARKVVANTLALAEQWRFSTGYPYLSQQGLFAADGKAIIGYFATFPLKYSQGILTALSLDDGQIIWQTYYDNPKHDVNFSDALLKPEMKRLYLLVYSPQVMGIDLQTGKQIWYSPKLDEHTAYMFVPESGNGQESPLLLRTNRGEVIALDPQTGELLSREKGVDSRREMHYQEITIKDTLNDGGLYAVDNTTGQILWREMEVVLSGYPTFIDQDLLVRYFSPYGKISRINIYTGAPSWMTEPEYISNYALSGDILYALHKDGRLVALDVNTGQPVGDVKFDIGLIEPGRRSFWVAVEGPYLLVYFGDSQELIAFKQDH